MPIQTLTTIRRARARAGGYRNGAARVLTKIQRGAALHQHFSSAGTTWTLSDRTKVAADIAKIVTTNVNLIGVNDCLFGSELSQTFRYIETRLAHERLFRVETEWRRHHDAANSRTFIPRNRDGRQSVVNAGDTTGGRTSHD
jgi:hypothetical protein